jgi:hypothetical protein
VYVGGRDPYSALPAARADAAPGTCGSDIGALLDGDPSTARLVSFAFNGSWSESSEVAVGEEGTELARLMGRTLNTVLVRRLSEETRAAAVADKVQEAKEQLAAAEALQESGTQGRVQSPELAVQFAQRQLEEATRQTSSLSGVGDELHSQVLVTHGTTVVGTDTDPGAIMQDRWTSAGSGEDATTIVSSSLSTCAAPGEPGGDPLPAGEYGVWVSYETGDGERAVTGPWSVTLLTPPPAPTGLPAGFPVDDVPLVGGRLLSAGRSGDGWGVEIAVDGDDAVSEAIRALGEPTPLVPTVSFSPYGYYPVGDWEVHVAASVSADGEPSVVYAIRPR